MDVALVYALFAALILTLLVVTVRLRRDDQDASVPQPPPDNRQAPP